MDRVVFKEKAKEVLRDNIWYLCGIVLICGLLTLEFFGYEVTYNEYGEAMHYVKVLNMQFQVNNVNKISFWLAGGSVVSLLYTIFVGNVISYARDNIFKYACLNDVRRLDLFAGFKSNHYMRIVMVNLLVMIQVFLYSLLLIIPGIIKMYEYRFVNEILEEHPDWDDNAILEESKRITMNHKMDLFIMDLSFFGWQLLFAFIDLVTFGLASRCFTVYPKATNAQAYLWLKEENRNDWA